MKYRSVIIASQQFMVALDNIVPGSTIRSNSFTHNLRHHTLNNHIEDPKYAKSATISEKPLQQENDDHEAINFGFQKDKIITQHNN